MHSGVAGQARRVFLSLSGCIHGVFVKVRYKGAHRSGVYWLKHLPPGPLGSVGWDWEGVTCILLL